MREEHGRDRSQKRENREMLRNKHVILIIRINKNAERSNANVRLFRIICFVSAVDLHDGRSARERLICAMRRA